MRTVRSVRPASPNKLTAAIIKSWRYDYAKAIMTVIVLDNCCRGSSSKDVCRPAMQRLLHFPQAQARSFPDISCCNSNRACVPFFALIKFTANFAFGRPQRRMAC